MNGDDVRVIAQPPHGLGFAAHARHVEPLALHEGDRDVSIQASVAREMDALLRTFPEKADKSVAATREHGRHFLARALGARRMCFC